MTYRLIEYVKRHVARAEKARTHSAKLLYLSDLMRKLFDVAIEELAPGVEEEVGSRVLGVRGKADLIFSDVIFEIKTDLEREIDDARTQLVKYLQALHELKPHERRIAIATDAVKFIAFVPTIENDRIVGIRQISSLDAKTRSVSETIVWLDSFIFSKPEIEPTAADLKIRFGRGSPLHAIGIDVLKAMWKEVGNNSDVKIKFDLWAKNMQIVYGVSPDLGRFLQHTYLVTLIKLAIYLRLAGREIPSREQVLKVLTGEYFESYGISNLIEEDFFSWILNEKILNRALNISSELVKALQRYDLSKAEEDLFKEIYEEMVELGQRHRLGEYYTPEWLSKKTILLALKHWNKGSKGITRMLDPACGSGTFLTNAIHILKTKLKPKKISNEQLLELIVSNVVGVDINPLAAIIARANYIIALGELLKLGKPVTIPVYIADSIKLPKAAITIAEGIEVYDIEANGHHLQIPKSISLDATKRTKVVNGLKEALKEYKLRSNVEQALQVLHRGISNIADKDEEGVLKQTLRTMARLVDKNLDSIWIFILYNIYATLSLKAEKFDVLISNPPWIVMRSIENRTYQDFLKEQIFAYDLLEKSQIHLFTHMEMATLFFCRTSELYLREGGIIAFLMPTSVLTGAYHHANFQRFERPKMKLLSVHNFRGVKSIFSLPLYILIAEKGNRTKYPVKAFDYVGKLNPYQKNDRLENVTDQITFTEYLYRPPIIPEHPSVYYKQFKEGATIVPHNLWFVDFEPMPSLGAFNISKPRVKTSSEVTRVAKKRWKDAELEGNIESDYFFATLLGKDLFSFGYVKFRPIVLPIEELRKPKGYRILDVDELRLRGARNMAEWLENAQEIWEERRTQKSATNFPRMIDRLDYHGLLRNQNKKRYIVLYNARGADSLGYVLDRRKLPSWTVERSSVRPVNFIADSTIFHFETNSPMEAHYLCALLNSNVVHQAVKGFQPSGLYGKRDIGRRPLKLAIPKFNSRNSDHMSLVALSKKCHRMVKDLCNTGEGFRKLRRKALKRVDEELKQIDELAEKIIEL